jgi:hypothetical protein
MHSPVSKLQAASEFAHFSMQSRRPDLGSPQAGGLFSDDSDGDFDSPGGGTLVKDENGALTKHEA